jgi:hypothetical protein
MHFIFINYSWCLHVNIYIFYVINISIQSVLFIYLLYCSYSSTLFCQKLPDLFFILKRSHHLTVVSVTSPHGCKKIKIDI